MEFDKDTASVSDEQRRSAETKKLTLEPIHGDVTPEETPDSEVVAQHLTGPAIQNAPNDIEQGRQPIQPAPQTQQPRPIPTKSPLYPRLLAGAVILACAAVTFVVLLLAQ